MKEHRDNVEKWLKRLADFQKDFKDPAPAAEDLAAEMLKNSAALKTLGAEISQLVSGDADPDSAREKTNKEIRDSMQEAVGFLSGFFINQ